MYAVVLIGSRQFKVCEGDNIEVEKLSTRKKTGEISLDKILLYSKGHQTKVGAPFLKDTKITAEILGESRAKKAISFKYRRRKSKRWKQGFRQYLTELKIKEIITK